MDIKSFNSALEFGKRTVCTSVILDTPFSREVGISMKRGHLIKEHQSPYPIIVHLLAGAVDFGVEGRSVHLSQGDIITLPGGVAHDLTAVEDSTIRLTLAKSDRAERIKAVVEDILDVGHHARN